MISQGVLLSFFFTVYTLITTLCLPSTAGVTMVTITEDGDHTLMCVYHKRNTFIWRINGSKYQTEIFPPGFSLVNKRLSDDRRVSELTFMGHQELNKTTIKCAIVFLNQSELSTLNVTVMIQGPLSSVTDLDKNGSTLYWVPPFSLDLTGVDPDIVYCVEMYNITCGRKELISDCNVTEPSYTSDDLTPHGYIYEYTVTPRSNVKGARNGTDQTVTEHFETLKLSSMGFSIQMMNKHSEKAIVGGDNGTFVRVVIYLDIWQEGIRPGKYSVFLKPLDGLHAYSFTLDDVTISSIQEFLIKLDMGQLEFRRLWNITVFAYDCEHHPLTEEMELGTHDFYNTSISSPNSGSIEVTGDIVDESSTIGILVITYSRFNDSNVHYSFIRYSDMHHHRMYPVITGLPADQYEVVVFVVEEDGKPFYRAAGTPRTVQINETMKLKVVPSPIAYKVKKNPTLTGVCVTCIFSSMDNSTDCVAVMHQRISQLSSSGLLNIESSHKFNRSGDTAFGCIEGIDLQVYQVGVVSQQSTTTRPLSAQCETPCIVACTVGVLLLTFLMLTFVLVYNCVRIFRKGPKSCNQKLIPTDTSVSGWCVCKGEIVNTAGPGKDVDGICDSDSATDPHVGQDAVLSKL